MSFLSYLNRRDMSTSQTTPKKFSLVDLIVFSSYYIFCVLLSLSLTGLFKKEFIILGLLVGLLFFSIFFWKRIEFKKYYLYFFIIVPLILTGVLLIRGCFGGDGIDYWLPWAKEIVLQERMPDFLLNNTAWLNSRMPVLPLFQAGIFSLFGFANWAIAFLPFFFAAASALLLYRWLLEKGVGKIYIIFGVLLLLTNPLFLNRAGEIGQESLILFFFTAFFYYLEKYQKTNNRSYFLLIFISFALASASKFSGLFLFLPLVWFIVKNKHLKKSLFYLPLTFLPSLAWLIRNYIVYDNPVYPLLNGVFKGQYYELFLTVDRIIQKYNPIFWDNVMARIAEIPVSLLLLFCPLGILAFYGFWKEKKIQYIVLFLVFLLLNLLLISIPDYVRYLIPFSALFIVYAIVGIEAVRSRIFLSFVFFFSLLGLFFTKISLSQSQFISPIEEALSSLKSVSQFVYDYRLILAIVLSVFFFFLILPHRRSAKYLILLLASAYLIKAYSFHLGSWVNVWLPILSLIFIILIWKLAIKLREEVLWKLVAVYIIILLMSNAWGLATVYFLAHGQFVFPNIEEAYGSQPQVAAEIEKLEGENRDFYVYTSSASYFDWYHNLKVVLSRNAAFHVLTNLEAGEEFEESFSPVEIYNLFQKYNIKYVIDNHPDRPPLVPFFNKIKSRPDLFKPILQKEGADLWLVKIQPQI